MKKKDLLQFCLKVVLLIAIVFVLDKGVGFAFVAMKDYGLKKNPESEWLRTANAIEIVSSDVVVIGSSTASHHYIPAMLADSLGMTVYNCGQDGCFFLYQNCVINMLLDRYHPKMIIWDMLPWGIDGNSESNEYQNNRYLSPYYPDNKWVASYIDSENAQAHIKMKSKMFANNSKLLYSLFPLVTKGTQTENGYIPLPSEGYEYPQIDIPDSDDSQFFLLPERLALLENTIERCKVEGVELKLVISPQYMYITNAFKGAISAISQTVEAYNHHLFDYSGTFLGDPTLFKDNIHLNHKGAIAFTSMLIKDILNEEYN